MWRPLRPLLSVIATTEFRGAIYVAESSGFDDAREFWDKRYRAPEYIFGTAPNRFLASQQSLFKPGDRVLDVACGEGRNSVWLASLGCAVQGVDISPLALDKARRLAA